MPLYDAFISYSHAKDKQVASALQSVMQKLGKPWYRRRALRIFRDDTSLAATPELWPTIERALGELRYLVLLASPQFAASKWCGLEVRRWLDDQGPASILIALTEGDLVWDEAAGDFHWSAATPLPDALRGQFKAEPKWIDLRPYREAPNANDVKFMEAAADLAAAVHGTPREDLLSQEVRQQRRALSLAWSAAGVLTVLAGLAAWQWREAVNQQRIAQAQRDRAELALSAATQTANTLVIDLANEFRDRTGMPSDLVRRILDRARGLQQQLLGAGENSRELLGSASSALDQLAITLLDLGETDAALEAAKGSYAVARRLVDEDPSNPDWRRTLSVALNKIGLVSMRAGQRAEAIAAYQELLAIIRVIADAEPDKWLWQKDVSATMERLGLALNMTGRREEALALLRGGVAILERLVAKQPDNGDLQRDLSVGYEHIADLYVLSRVGEALELYRRSLALRQNLANGDPANAARQRDLSVVFERIGEVLEQGWRYDEALEHYGKSRAIRERLVASDPANAGWQGDLAITHQKLGGVLVKMKRRGGGAAALSRRA